MSQMGMGSLSGFAAGNSFWLHMVELISRAIPRDGMWCGDRKVNRPRGYLGELAGEP